MTARVADQMAEDFREPRTRTVRLDIAVTERECTYCGKWFFPAVVRYAAHWRISPRGTCSQRCAGAMRSEAISEEHRVKRATGRVDGRAERDWSAMGRKRHGLPPKPLDTSTGHA